MKQTHISDSWLQAVRLLQTYTQQPQKADTLLEELQAERAHAAQQGGEAVNSGTGRRTQALFLGTLRNLGLISYYIKQFVPRAPKPTLHAVLCVTAFELMETDNPAATVHHGVAGAKKLCSLGEAKLANAVLRKLMAVLKSEAALSKLPLATRYSHSAALVKKWQAAYGVGKTIELLQWNQQTPQTFVQLAPGAPEDTPQRAGLQPTQWEHFYALPSNEQATEENVWDVLKPLFEAGQAYVQDPMTRLPLQLANVQPGEDVLELCAAPGGKSVWLARILKDTKDSTLVCSDMYPRTQRLETNLKPHTWPGLHILEIDALELSEGTFTCENLPQQYHCVLLDAPCSNTGVIRRRPDVKGRYNAQQLKTVTILQAQLLTKAAPCVAPGGRLVYSTCSLEAEENQTQAEKFLIAHPHFTLTQQHLATPFEHQHDGGGTFVFTKG